MPLSRQRPGASTVATPDGFRSEPAQSSRATAAWITVQGRAELGRGGRQKVVQLVVWIDVSKAESGIAILPSGEPFTLSK
jgi:hypothetical protein